MIVIYTVLGLLMGSIINWAVDYLPRFTVDRSLVPANLQPRLTLALIRPTRSLMLNVSVEIVTAVWFAYAWLQAGTSWPSVWLAAVGALFILVAAIDLKYRLILNAVIYPAAILIAILQIGLWHANYIMILIGAVFGLIIFLMVAWLRPEDLGGGDIKLAALIGLLFGFPHVLWALLIGVVAGGLAVGWLVIVRHWHAKAQIPYAPFLCLGALIALLYNPFATLFPL